MSTCISNYGRRSAAIPIDGYNGPLTVRVNNSSDYFKTLGPVISVKGSRSIIAQLQNTFGWELYITPFGEKPGTLEITVLSAEECGSSDQVSGDFINFFNRHMFRGGRPSTIAIGRGALRGIMFGQSFGIDEKTRYATVTFTYVVWSVKRDAVVTGV